VTIYHKNPVLLEKFEMFLQKLLWEKLLPNSEILRLKASVSLTDGKKVTLDLLHKISN